MDVECISLSHLGSPRRSKAQIDDGEVKNGQKENVYMDVKGTSPLKCEPASSVFGGKRGLGSDPAHITPSKHQERVSSEPLTPTANLKLLMNAASPDIRDRELRKILFRPIENEDTEVTLSDHGQLGPVDDRRDEFDQRPSRKQKSLGLLCQKFLARYPNYPASSETISISLDEVATNLGVERRRIYDIVNVLESLKLVSRVAKNQYVWHGRRQLQHTLRELHGLAQRSRCQLQAHQASEGRARPAARAEDPAEGREEGTGCPRKDKSLRIMSQRFVMLFLVSDTQTVTLDLAAKILIEESEECANHSKYKTKVRRLYDIANVLTSLKLIEKVHLKEERGRKPAFKWTGPVDFKNGSGDVESALSFPEFHGGPEQTKSQGKRSRLARHVSFSVMPVPVCAQRRVSSAPCSPSREVMGLISGALDYSGKTEDGLAVRQVQLACEARAQRSRSVLFASEGSVVPLPGLYGSAAQSCASVLSLSPAPRGEDPELHPQAPLAYFPGLAQAPLVMLYRGPAAGKVDPHVQRSPPSEPSGPAVQKRGAEDCEGQAAKRIRTESMVDIPQKGCAGYVEQEMLPASCRLDAQAPSSAVCPQGDAPLHYLYVPNSAGLNLLLSSEPAAGLALGSSPVPALALPYVLLPSALPSYPLITGGVPTMMSPAHLVVGARAVSMPESRLSSALCSPGQAQTSSNDQPQTPLTPKEAGTSAQTFFHTPSTLSYSDPKVARKRGSAQRRLDIGHPLTN